VKFGYIEVDDSRTAWKDTDKDQLLKKKKICALCQSVIGSLAGKLQPPSKTWKIDNQTRIVASTTCIGAAAKVVEEKDGFRGRQGRRENNFDNDVKVIMIRYASRRSNCRY
jgi:hypothetical protein